MVIDSNFNLNDVITNNVKWINPIDSFDIRIYGFNWIETDHIYRRLPLSTTPLIDKVCPNINHLAYKTAGGQIHFYTDSKKLIVKAKLREKVSLAGMTAVSQGGFDCYVGTNYDDLKFYDSTRFNIEEKEYQTNLFENKSGRKLVVINFPLYGGISELSLGFDVGSYLEKPEDLSSNNKIVIYGTSITQGGCASRPGLSFPNILSRRLKCEFINLGFSGNAFGEIEVARIVASIENASMFILDYEANGGTNGKLALTLEEFIKTIREKSPFSAIVVMSRIKYLFDDLNPAQGKIRASIRKFQVDVVNKFNKNGDDKVYFIDGSKLLGKDYHEYTIDSVHPNDLGFMKIANNVEKQIRKILKI